MTLTTPNPYLPADDAHTLCEVIDATRVSVQALFAIDRVTPARYVHVLLGRLVDLYAAGEGRTYFAAAYGVAWEVARVAHSWAEQRHIGTHPDQLAALTGDLTTLAGVNHAYQAAAFEGRLHDADRLIQQVAYHPEVARQIELRRGDLALQARAGWDVSWDEAREAVRAVSEACLHLLRSMLAIERAEHEWGTG